jgi:lipopolysaccharide biosynthesis glycosyltransferase
VSLKFENKNRQDESIHRFHDDIRVVHFAGYLKPWQLTYNPQIQQLLGNLHDQQTIQQEFLLQWWHIMYERVWPQLSSTNQVFTQLLSSLA